VVSRPFCATAEACARFDAWCSRLRGLGVELADTDLELVGVIASRQARLAALGEELAREADPDRRLRIGAAERMAALDVLKALDAAERAWGGVAVEGEAEPAVVQRTGTDDGRVVPFRAPGLGVVAQRVAAAVAKAGPLTKGELRRRVPGAQGAFLRGLREALAAGAVVREGDGRKGRPFKYRTR